MEKQKAKGGFMAKDFENLHKRIAESRKIREAEEKALLGRLDYLETITKKGFAKLGIKFDAKGNIISKI